MRERYTLPPDGMCEGPVEIAAVAGPLEARVNAVLKSAGYTNPHIVKTIAPTQLVVTGVRGAKDAQTEFVLLVALDARHPILELGSAGFHNATGGIEVALYAPFLGRSDVYDLSLTIGSSNGMRSSTSTTHHLVRTPRTAPTLACTFDGGGVSGMEDVTNSSTLKITKRSEEPFSFS